MRFQRQIKCPPINRELGRNVAGRIGCGSLSCQGCHRSGNGQGKKILKGQRKVGEFYFESGKFTSLS